MTAPTLTEFLLTRVAEDEEWARSPEFDHGDPDRALAECEAKRGIVEEHPDYGGYGKSCATCAEDAETLTPWPCPTLRHLAAVYADHSSYRQEWKP